MIILFEQQATEMTQIGVNQTTVMVRIVTVKQITRLLPDNMFTDLARFESIPLNRSFESVDELSAFTLTWLPRH